jgi:hypothetical protein
LHSGDEERQEWQLKKTLVLLDRRNKRERGKVGEL